MRRHGRWLGLIGLILAGLALWLAQSDVDAPTPEVSGTRDPEPSLGDAPTLRSRAPPDAPTDEQAAPATAEDAVPPPATAAAPTVRIHGLVRRADGAPVPECDIYVRLKRDARRGDPQQPWLSFIELDVEGGAFSATIPVRDLSQYWLCAMPHVHGGCLPAFLDGARIVPGERVDLVLPPGRVLEVEAVDVNGLPMDDVQISLSPLDTERISRCPLPDEPTMGSWSIPSDPGSNRKRFVLPYAGPLRAEVRKKGYARSLRIIEPHEESVRLVLRQPNSRIRVRLLNAAAWPGAVALVVSADPRYGAHPPRVAQASFVDGLATLENVVVAGSWNVRVWASDAAPLVLGPIEITSASHTAEVAGRLLRAEGLGRLHLACEQDGRTEFRCMVRPAGKAWTRWFHVYRREEGFELRMLPVGRTEVLLTWKGGRHVIHVRDHEVRDREDHRVTPAVTRLRAFTWPDPPPVAAPTASLSQAWIQTSTGKSSRVLGVREVFANAEFPYFLTPRALVDPDYLILTPAAEVTLHWELLGGQTGKVELVPHQR